MQENICFAGPGSTYCGYRDLLEYIVPRINRLGREEAAARLGSK